VTTPSILKLRYPAFASVSDATCAYWLSDASRIVTAAWGQDYEPATLALAAHNMRKSGALADDSELGPGVTSFKSASVSISVSEATANRAADVGYGSTVEGAEFAVMLRRNCGGPFLAGCR
jgi:hypothetical protein